MEPEERFDWRARLRDAASFGEHVSPPLVWGGDLAFRAVLLVVVAGITALFLSLLTSPALAVFGRTVGVLADKFDVEITDAELPNIAQRSVVVDSEGRVLATLAGEENRIVTPLDKVPLITQQAVLAVEDSKFYNHHGVDLQGLARATLLNFRSGTVRQGGSTITQQLVKNTIVGTERSLERKIKEAKLAVELEKRMSKDEILELYLNEVYLGRGYYGFGAAAEYYFDKRVQELTLAESALLAGIIKAPESYEPIANPEEALARRTTVLRRMLDEGFISSVQFERANTRELGAQANRLPPAQTPYFVEYVKLRILEDPRFGDTREERARALFQAGLRIETTLDLPLQKAAQRASDDVLDLKNDPSSALVSIDPKTGAIRAMVGGRDFEESKFNLAVQGTRQPGSTFKPVAMMAALEAGFAPTQTYDSPAVLKLRDAEGKPYKVPNYDRKPRGLIDMREATKFSVNTYYVQLAQAVGPAAIADMGTRLGVTTELDPVISLTLGTTAVSPLEMASVYATIANEGVHCEPFGITRVADSNGNTIIRETPTCERHVSKAVIAQGVDMLVDVIESGTGRANGQIGRPAGGKTGTTDEYTDAWFAGFTPQYSTVVWIGYPEDTTRSLYNIHGLRQVYGGSLPAMIWNRYMTRAHRGLPVERFPRVTDIDAVKVPNVVGMPWHEARTALEQAGFTAVKQKVAGYPPKGRVLQTAPRPGKKVDPGIAVRVQVSDGSVPRPLCNDGLDNDGDGETDFPEDNGCDSAEDNSEKDPPQCSDGKDNDGDGKVDGNDPGCSGDSDNDETDPKPECNDGKDNDGDGKTDHPDDPGCQNKSDDDESDPPPSPSPSPSPTGGG